MADLEAGIVTLLQASAGVTALIGSGTSCRLYPLLVPEDFASYPAMTYQVVSETRQPLLTKQSGLMNARVQLSCWARTYAGATALKEAVRNAVDGSGTTFGSGVFIENGLDTIEISEGAEPLRLYCKRVDLSVWVAQEDPTLS